MVREAIEDLVSDGRVQIDLEGENFDLNGDNLEEKVSLAMGLVV